MDISASVSSPSMDQLGSVQGQAQIAMLKKATDLRAQQVEQLLQAVPQPATAQAGQPGGVINTFA